MFMDISMEERPDVAKLYMTLYKILNSNEDYPLLVIIDYSQVPLYMGTFDNNISSLLPLLKDIKATYENDKSLINDSYNEIINFLRLKKKSLNTNLQVTKKAIKDGFLLSSQVFDPYYGGFESLPKYPSPHKLIFLLKFGITENMINPTEMVEKTLISMYKGGLYDHLAGGFLRYST
ncbi:DUF255 domain-containing protein, partial [Clostridium sp.]|uniref:DUF255 domain-containing protein n=1 Tax=Clostridium sp. TaxID=1506 RepID=UPI003F3196F7